MQKKILTVAIGAALSAVSALSAQADVKVYGAAQLEIGQVTCDTLPGTTTISCGPNSLNTTKPSGSTTTARDSFSFVGDNKRGRIGVLADEDLGNGLTGLAKFEWNLDTADNLDNASGPFSARDSWVGLQSKTFGTLRLGQSGSPYKQSGVALDPWLTTSLEARNNYGMSGNRDGYGVLQAHNSFLGNGVWYTTAGNLGGAYVDAYVGADSGENQNGNLSVVAGWKGKVGVDLNAFVGYIRDNNAHSATVNEPNAIKVGASIGIAKMHTINLQYEKVDAAIIGAGSDPSADYLYLNYQFKIAGVTATASFGQMKDTDGTQQVDGTYYAVGALYNFSKTFRVHAGFRSTELENTSFPTVANSTSNTKGEKVFAVGMRKDF